MIAVPVPNWVLVLLAGIWLTIASIFVWNVFPGKRILRRNFMGQEIPVGMGLCISLFMLPILIAFAIRDTSDRSSTLSAAAVIAVFTCVGLLDDFAGNRSDTGLKGHIKALVLEHKVTTGLVKLVAGCLIALSAAAWGLGRPWPWPLVDGAIIALSANLINILDLRPGRACAGFAVLAISLSCVMQRDSHIALRLMSWSIPPWLILYESDRRGYVMMGDCGSNVLGAILGFAAAAGLGSISLRIGLLTLLVAIHVITEKWSLSKIIDQSSLLNRIDRLTGVRQAK